MSGLITDNDGMDDPGSPVELDPNRQEKARVYARQNRRLEGLELLITAFYILAWLVIPLPGGALNLAAALQLFLSSWTTNELLLVAGFSVVFFGLLALILLPISFYSGYVLPHRYGLSNQSDLELSR